MSNASNYGASLSEESNSSFSEEKSSPNTKHSSFDSPSQRIDKKLSLNEQTDLWRGSTRYVEVEVRKEVEINSVFQKTDSKFQRTLVETHSGSPKERSSQESSRNRLLRAYRFREMYLLPRFVSQENGSKRKLEPGEFHPNSQLYPLLTPLKDLSEFGIVASSRMFLITRAASKPHSDCAVKEWVLACTSIQFSCWVF